MAESKFFEIEVQIPEGLTEGDTFRVEIEVPAIVKKKRGSNGDIALADMTDDQLKREIVNANSVLYKARQRDAGAEVIAKHQERADAALAEKAKRTPPEDAPVVLKAVVKAPAAAADELLVNDSSDETADDSSDETADPAEM